MDINDITDIMKHLPHRYPFLLVDRILSITPGQSIVGLKNVTINEPFFNGHFPDRPVMPGVLMLEALAQAAGILSFKSMGVLPEKDGLYLLIGIDKARFKRMVVPGDALTLEVTMSKPKMNLWRFQAEAKVEGKLAVSAQITSYTQDSRTASKLLGKENE